MPDQVVPWYAIDELGQVPTGAGLYAWYAVPIAGPHDRKSAEQLGKLLARHSRTLKHPDLRLEVTWHLGALWSGELPEGGVTSLASLLDDLATGVRKEPATDLYRTLGHAGHRQLLADVLLTAAPRLSAPLYVGISRGLRGRLHTHRSKYEAAREAIAAGDDPLAVLGNHLGTRLAAARIPPEALRVTALEVESLNGLTKAEARRISAAVEYVINRWQHPIFGEK
jgi:hypothetical protein